MNNVKAFPNCENKNFGHGAILIQIYISKKSFFLNQLQVLEITYLKSVKDYQQLLFQNIYG